MFHDRVVDAHTFGRSVRLDNEHIPTTNGFFESTFNLTVCKVNEPWVTQFDAEVLRNFMCKGRVRSACEQMQSLFGYEFHRFA